ncbi:MAG: hypothetical protein LBR32_07970, partial [Propionibacteriaceae bacterium]|nr:hypothetical protein [Propionibacteriaceae bacterium]
LRNGQPLSPPEPTRQRLLGATYVPLLDEAGADVALRRTWGACAVDYPKLFTGEVDFIAYRTMFPWDHLAGALMVEELGGKSATDEGAPYCAGAVGRRIISAMAEEAWATACETLKLR